MSRLSLSRLTQLVVGERPGSAPVSCPLVPVLRVVAGDELVQVRALQRVRLQGEVLVGAQVVDPELLRPRRLAGGLAVEEQHVGLHALGVEDAGRQAQQGVDVALVQQPPPDRLARAALEQHVVRHHDRGAAVDLQQCLDVLEEVELLVAGGGPEVVADDVSASRCSRPPR